MGRVIMNGPPDAPDTAGWCVTCLCLLKQRQYSAFEDDIKAGLEKPGDELTVIPWPPGLMKELRLGEYRSVPGNAPQLGVVEGLCWDCVAGLQPAHQSRLVDGAGIPAGLLKGRGR